MKNLWSVIMVAMVLSLVGNRADAHCEIPCGIYDDAARLAELAEHATTIEKSMTMIRSLSGETKRDEADENQLVRWVNNKEIHASAIQEIVSDYFLTQRIKPVEPGDEAAAARYHKELALLHKMLVNAMKAKQTVEIGYVETLRTLINEFSDSYMGE